MPDPAATLALCAWLKKRIAVWETEAKSSLELVEGERKAAQLNGATVAYTTKVKGRARVDITDHEGFIGWVEQRWPTEIVKDVNPAFHNRLLKDALQKGALIDEGGEVCPHVEVEDGAPYFMTKLTGDADMFIGGLLHAGRLGPNGLKELPPEPTDRWTQDTAEGAIGG